MSNKQALIAVLCVFFTAAAARDAVVTTVAGAPPAPMSSIPTPLTDPAQNLTVCYACLGPAFSSNGAGYCPATGYCFQRYGDCDHACSSDCIGKTEKCPTACSICANEGKVYGMHDVGFENCFDTLSDCQYTLGFGGKYKQGCFGPKAQTPCQPPQGQYYGYVELSSDPADNCFLSGGDCDDVADADQRPDPSITSCQFLDGGQSQCSGPTFNLKQSDPKMITGAAMEAKAKHTKRNAVLKKELKAAHIAKYAKANGNGGEHDLSCAKCTAAGKAYWYDNQQFGGAQLVGCLDTLADCQFAGKAWANDGDEPQCAAKQSECPNASPCQACINVQQGIWCPQENYCFSNEKACKQAGSKCTCTNQCSNTTAIAK